MASGFNLPPLPRSNYGGDSDRVFSRFTRRDVERDPRQRFGDERRRVRGDDDDDEDEFEPRNPHRDENRRLAELSKSAPITPWDEFLRELDWKMGEHFAMIGPTGQGKTTMLLNLLPMHPFVTVFATKPRDESMDRLILQGYVKLERWRSLDAKEYPRRVLWPDASKIDSEDRQTAVFRDAFARIYREGGWTLAIDELWYIVNVLKLAREVRVFLLQARALGISLVCATQRPAYVPLEVYDQSTHLMFWRDNDETNLKRISGFSSGNAAMIRHVVSRLDRYQVLYLNTRTGRMLRTRCPVVR